MSNYDAVIVGGGASGASCASFLSKNGNFKVAVIEADERIGKKLSKTGNGQGNVSNTDMSAWHYRGSVSELAGKIACADKEIYGKLFNCLFVADGKGRIYPSGKQASALCDSLVKTLKSQGAEIFTGTQVNGIDIKNGEFIFSLSGGKSVSSKYAVVCTGGLAQPVCKSLSPYLLAESTGHKLAKRYPSLVQLKTDAKDIKTLRGLRADCSVTAFTDGKKSESFRGDVIFTDFGVSGNAVFAVSPAFADKQGVLSIEFLPEISADEIIRDIENKKKLGYEQSELLSGTVHNQIGRAVIKRANCSDGRRIACGLKNFELNIVGTLGFDYAQATRGGVIMDDITDDLESKKIKNLFFAGEILDIDGDCGGYNLQWAFASGAHVAETILKRI